MKPCKDCVAEGVTTNRPAPHQGERWLPIVGYEGLYEVSDRGRVRSLDRIIVGGDKAGNRRERVQRGRVLRQTVCSFGYRRQELVKDGRRKSFAVHRLVAESFIGPAPSERHEVRHHPDPGPSNNQVSNLLWGTHSENVRDTVNGGRYVSRHRNKTGCPAGHPYSGTDVRGVRICHTCRREQQRAYRARKAAS